MTTMTSSSLTREDWLQSTRKLCDLFANKGSMEDIVETFSPSRPDEILLFEHGLPELASFLGRSFTGKSGIRDYFGVVSDHLSYKDMSFSDFIFDADLKVASVRGKAEFTWKSTGKSWKEVFLYRIKLDDEGKILVYEVWADSGAAYLSSLEDS